jgi:cyclophilin family peptidyl-prolyl cis-trans isomerase
VPEGEPVDLPPVAPGAALTGPTPCPAADGSSPRTTSFEQAPPTCTQADRNYNAVVHTSEGDLTLLLNTRQAPVGVNNFVVLARYHFWDGAPITNIEPRVAFQVQGFIDGSTPSPGYTIANEAPPEGTLQIVGNPSFVVPQAGDGTVIDPGRFQMALGEEAAGLPRNTPVLGILLDDGARDGGDVGTLQKIRRAGSTTGAPTRVITISSIDVTEEPAGTA